MNWRGIRIHVTHHAVQRFLQRGLGLVDPHRSIVRLLVTAEPYRPEDWRRLADVVEHGNGSVQWRTKSGIVLAVVWEGRWKVVVTSVWVPGTASGCRSDAMTD